LKFDSYSVFVLSILYIISVDFFTTTALPVFMESLALSYKIMEISEHWIEAASEPFTERSVFKLKRHCYASYNGFKDWERCEADIIEEGFGI
jgi:hypothetical protein